MMDIVPVNPHRMKPTSRPEFLALSRRWAARVMSSWCGYRLALGRFGLVAFDVSYQPGCVGLVCFEVRVRVLPHAGQVRRALSFTFPSGRSDVWDYRHVPSSRIIMRIRYGLQIYWICGQFGRELASCGRRAGGFRG